MIDNDWGAVKDVHIGKRRIFKAMPIADPLSCFYLIF